MGFTLGKSSQIQGKPGSVHRTRESMLQVA
jgi:hypothetical protein